MAISKLIFNNVTQMDVTTITATEADVASGKTFLLADGTVGTGTASGGGGSPTIDSLSVTPTESEQTFNSSSVDGYKPVIVGAISDTYIGSAIDQRDSDDLTASGATVTVPEGYYAAAASKSIPTGTAVPASTISATAATITTGTGTITLTKTVSNTPNVSTAGYISAGTAGNSSISLTASVTINPTVTASGKTVTVPAGYYTSQTTKDVATGSATGPSSLSGSSATITTGTNTITLTKTGVTTTPTVSAGYVSSATASTATVALTASVTTKAATTITPSTSDQTIASGTYLTGTQTIEGDANLVASNIKKNVQIFGVTGSYEGSGGGLTIATATSTLSSANSSISFTGLAGEPTSFAIVSAGELATGASPWKTAAVVFDGTDLHGQTIRNTSNAQVTYDGSDFSKSYSNGTLTVAGSGTNFQANQYKLIYTYGGSDIGTADVQVGSGATSITFTGLEEEPSYFSCIFKSNFTTSSGYQRVIVIVHDGTSTYGMEMDSSAKYSNAHWSYSYSSGSLTISSSGTNAGGYFHQPGYYQLTYATEGSSGNYQNKTITPSASQQEITADSGYDALKKVTVEGDADLIASNIKNGVTIFGVTGSYEGSGGSSKNVQVLQSTTRVNASSLTKALGDMTVSKTGTYDIYWSGGRSNTSTSYTWGTQLYIGSTAYGSENTTWTNNVQSNHLSNISLTANQKLSVYARGRTGSYYTFVPMLVIIES